MAPCTRGLVAAAAAAAAAVVAAAAAATGVAAARGVARDPRPNHMAREKVNPCGGTVTLPPVRCPCVLTWEIFTRGLLPNVSFAFVATVPPTRGGIGSDLALVATNVTADYELENEAAAPSDPLDYWTDVQYRRLGVDADVSVHVGLEAGAWAAGCPLADVHVGVMPVAPACPVLNVSLAGRERGRSAAIAVTSTAATAADRQAARPVAVGSGRPAAPRIHPPKREAASGGGGVGVGAVAAVALAARILGGSPLQRASGERSLKAVLIDNDDDEGFCSCTFLPARYALTAAHCLGDYNYSVRVVVTGQGDPVAVTLPVIDAAVHSRYAIDAGEYAV